MNSTFGRAGSAAPTGAAATKPAQAARIKDRRERMDEFLRNCGPGCGPFGLGLASADRLPRLDADALRSPLLGRAKLRPSRHAARDE
jgi:hypothetical protein